MVQFLSNNSTTDPIVELYEGLQGLIKSKIPREKPPGFSQEDFQKYREDQIYFSVYYNSLGNQLNNFKENKFSSSFNLGFIRDIPISKSGKFAKPNNGSSL